MEKRFAEMMRFQEFMLIYGTSLQSLTGCGHRQTLLGAELTAICGRCACRVSAAQQSHISSRYATFEHSKVAKAPTRLLRL